VLILYTFAYFPEFWMVAVLLPALGIEARGLNVAVGVRADPDLCPGRRDSKGTDAAQDFLIGD